MGSFWKNEPIFGGLEGRFRLKAGSFSENEVTEGVENYVGACRGVAPYIWRAPTAGRVLLIQ
jgi:hypothetical protein